MVRRLLYWFNFKIVGIQELNRLPYEERARIIGAVRQAMFWDEMSDRRQIFWFLLYFHASFVCGFFHFIGYGGIAIPLLVAIAAGWIFDGRARYTKVFHDHVRRILAEKAKADAAAKT